MRKLLFLFFFGLGLFTAKAQFISSVSKPDSTREIITDVNDPSVRFANTITTDDLKKHLYKLASDDFEGRETGQPGNIKAADYLAAYFDSLKFEKLPNGTLYRQAVNFTFTSWDDTDIYVNGLRFRHLWDYLSYPTKNSDLPLLETNEVLFLGYGIDDPKYSDYNGKDMKGKAIVINMGEPQKEDGSYWISGTTETSVWSDIEKN